MHTLLQEPICKIGIQGYHKVVKSVPGTPWPDYCEDILQVVPHHHHRQHQHYLCSSNMLVILHYVYATGIISLVYKMY